MKQYRGICNLQYVPVSKIDFETVTRLDTALSNIFIIFSAVFVVDFVFLAKTNQLLLRTEYYTNLQKLLKYIVNFRSLYIPYHVYFKKVCMHLL